MILGNGLLGSRSALLGCAPLLSTPTPPPAPYVSGGGYPITQPPPRPRDNRALLHRDYRERDKPKRVTRVDATLTVEALSSLASVGLLRARGTGQKPLPPAPVVVDPRRDAVVRAGPVMAESRLGTARRRSAIGRTAGRSPLTADEAFLLGFAAGAADGD